jgi:hypothetical protein
VITVEVAISSDCGSVSTSDSLRMVVVEDPLMVVGKPWLEGWVLSPDSSWHWENVYRKIIGIYRNFYSKLLNSCLVTVSEVFLVLIAPILLFLLLFISTLKY